MDDYKKKLIQGAGAGSESKPSAETPSQKSPEIKSEAVLIKELPKETSKKPREPKKDREKQKQRTKNKKKLEEKEEELQEALKGNASGSPALSPNDVDLHLRVYKEQLKEEFSRSRNMVLGAFGAFALAFVIGTWATAYWVHNRTEQFLQIDRSTAEKKIEEKVDAQLAAMKLPAIVEKISKEQIGRASDEYVAVHLQDKITELDQKIDKTIQEVQTRADQTFANLDSILSFVLVLTRARNDDRVAFDYLLNAARSPGSKYQPIAQNAITTIYGEVAQGPSQRIDPPYPWGRGSIDRVSFDQFKTVYGSAISLHKPFLLTELWQNPKYTMQQKLSFLADVIRDDSSLRAVQRATQLMNEVAALDKPFTEYSAYLDWWEKNESKYRKL